MYYVYILQSEKTGRYYIGQTEDVSVRLAKHNSGQVNATKFGRTWRLIHTEKCSSRSQAVFREREIKSYKGGILFKRILGLWKD